MVSAWRGGTLEGLLEQLLGRFDALERQLQVEVRNWRSRADQGTGKRQPCGSAGPVDGPGIHGGITTFERGTATCARCGGRRRTTPGNLDRGGTGAKLSVEARNPW